VADSGGLDAVGHNAGMPMRKHALRLTGEEVELADVVTTKNADPDAFQAAQDAAGGGISGVPL
jgi:hypothetical protein